MKKILVLVTFCLSMTFVFFYGKNTQAKSVEAIFVGIDKQPSGGADDLIDTVWIYYDDMTFDQYAEVDNGLVYFSHGIYNFENRGGFIPGLNDSSKRQIVLNRDKKFQYGKGVVDYSSLHTYDLYSLGFDPIFLSNDGQPKLVAILTGDNNQVYSNNSKTQRVDALWLFFDDGTFKQYLEVNKKIEYFSVGTYKLLDGASFTDDTEKQNKEFKITINREKMYQDRLGMVDFINSHTYSLNDLNLNYIWCANEKLFTNGYENAKNKKTNFLNWNDDTLAVKELVKYVEEVTNKDSKKYIPKDERIAVFDMDGTLFCETDPTYYEYQFLFEKIIRENDSQVDLDDETKTMLNEAKEVIKTGVVSDELELKLSMTEYRYHLNMDIDSYKKQIKEFLNKETKSYTNLLIKDAFYKPMLDVVKYLQENDFDVYVVSGTERNFVRTTVCDVLNIMPNKVIGMDFTLKASKQGDEKNSIYQFSRDEDVVIAGEPLDVNIKTNKVLMIAEEIGMVPVLAFGNSTGDFSMLEYTKSNKKYDTRCFMVLCDDVVRENGNIEKANKIKKTVDEKGHIAISMKNDWKTIYGENVIKR